MLNDPDFYQDFFLWAAEQPQLTRDLEQLETLIAQNLSVGRWGDLPQWQAALDALPQLKTGDVQLDPAVHIGHATDITPEQSNILETELKVLHPWRKGPVHLFGLHIDTEWRSDWKWDRVKPHLDDLSGRRILDVGCGNGYYCLRMMGAGAERVIGIDPSVKFVYQFYALKKYLGNLAVDVLPLGIEQVPQSLNGFDTVFSMGVLYHRRSPIDHILELKQLIRPEGQLVLETLIVEGDEHTLLVPPGRYAKMRNVWFFPSADMLIGWLKKCGLKNPQVVDICPTTIEEQRSTDWMRFESLPDFLDPQDPSRTIEGHPGPIRAVFTATV